jgi:hypothetical protein
LRVFNLATGELLGTLHMGEEGIEMGAMAVFTTREGRVRLLAKGAVRDFGPGAPRVEIRMRMFDLGPTQEVVTLRSAAKRA